MSDAIPPATEPGPGIAGALTEVRERIAVAARTAGRDPRALTLVAVSKTQPVARIEAALAAGHRIFGENRVQEALQRWTPLRPRFAELQLHLIGPLQTNKARDAVAFFDVIQSLDRPKLARALAEAMQATGRRPLCFVQVNIGEEPQKAGVPPADADAFVASCREDWRLPIAGLMCIPPVDRDPQPYFARLAEMGRRIGLPGLSMGMSGDFETAVRLGATHLRVGTAIFGTRDGR